MNLSLSGVSPGIYWLILQSFDDNSVPKSVLKTDKIEVKVLGVTRDSTVPTSLEVIKNEQLVFSVDHVRPLLATTVPFKF